MTAGHALQSALSQAKVAEAARIGLRLPPENALIAASAARDGTWLRYLLDEPALASAWSMPGRHGGELALHRILAVTHISPRFADDAVAAADVHEDWALRVLARTHDLAINYRTEFRDPPLLLAIDGGFPRVLRALLERRSIDLDPELTPVTRWPTTRSVAAALATLRPHERVAAWNTFLRVSRDQHLRPLVALWCALGEGHLRELAELIWQYAAPGIPASCASLFSVTCTLHALLPSAFPPPHSPPPPHPAVMWFLENTRT
jgi:hypothetical protein